MYLEIKSMEINIYRVEVEHVSLHNMNKEMISTNKNWASRAEQRNNASASMQVHHLRLRKEKIAQLGMKNLDYINDLFRYGEKFHSL